MESSTFMSTQQQGEKEQEEQQEEERQDEEQQQEEERQDEEQQGQGQGQGEHHDKKRKIEKKEAVEIETIVKCPICLEEYAEQEMVKFTRCVHFLCKECYEHFLQTSNKCPVCRTPLEDEITILSRTLSHVNSCLVQVQNDLQKLKTINSRHLINEVMGSTNEDMRSLQREFANTRQSAIDVINNFNETGITNYRQNAPIVLGALSIDSVYRPLPPPPTNLSFLENLHTLLSEWSRNIPSHDIDDG